MSEMVERVAQAIMNVPVEEKISDYYAQARAAIAAMREPTDAMTREGNKYTDWADGADAAWEAMVDEALK